ncbi:MAG: hypothetical protein D4R56_00875 [Deltaproteobacteria bacterium]|nr:MAG: hypothetical protein D4R56_00875 [Deltaproteobacteria bacterium]
MKTCKRCLREYEDSISVHKNPAHELGELFLKATEPEEENDLCPDCREEMGIFTLLGFGQ